MSEGETAGGGAARKGKKKNRSGRVMSVSLSFLAFERICFLARQGRISRSRVIENLVAAVDYPQMFELFEAGARLAQIVILTRQPPAIVRAIFAEYMATRDEKVPNPVPPPPAPPAAPAAAMVAAPSRAVRNLPRSLPPVRRLGPARS